ncbi:hypothetical protein OKW21_000496 [Catalinimonas alkaloidigena]|uniref:hypothetical protein n=1 Tax=Catalinimonas alkaloidigena TaxID=1075417 RepID=UPI0024050691|nr:hypothetical protein [Catalinimonas alkaloidigena]MDF9795233.1 hypothetical protein [Catalinimonas alkaloidigena]
MKIKKLFLNVSLILGLILSANTLLCAQDYVFQVLAIDGEALYMKGDHWQAVELGQSLMANDIVRVERNTYLGLAHQNGATLSLRKEGTYEIDHLSSKVGNQKRNVASKYANLYVKSLKNASNKTVTASAERGIDQNRVKIFLPNSVDVFNDEVILRWKNMSTIDEKYEVKLKNMFNEVIAVEEVQDTKTVLNFKDEKIAKERMIIVSVNSTEFKDQQSNDYGMKHLTPEEAAPIAQELKELKLEITDEQSALDKLILASFYEQNNLLADALTNYEYAISLAPEVEAFRVAYNQFIFRNGLAN